MQATFSFSRLLSRLGISLLCFACFAVVHAADDELPVFGTFFEEQSVVMLVIEPDSGAIQLANPAAAEFYGYPREKLQTLRIQDINALSEEQVAAERQLAIAEDRNFFIFRHRLASGEVRSVQVHSQPYTFNDQAKLFSIIHDITPDRFEASDIWHYQLRLEELVDQQVQEIEQRKTRQQRLLFLGLLIQALAIVLLAFNILKRKKLQHEKNQLLHSLKEKNAELIRLSEVMAHHFQEPARRLMTFAGRLKNEPALQANSDTQSSVEFIDNQARRLSALVRDVQRFLALEHPLPEQQLESTDTLVQKAILEADIPVEEVQWEIAQSLPWVALDRCRFKHLLVALLNNAWRYRHPDRKLIIRLQGRVVGERVVFKVIDNGQGVSEEYREKIFELFQRLVPSSMPGTGLGLALARKMVRQSGGEMTIEDGLMGGIAIRFDLPKAEEARDRS